MKKFLASWQVSLQGHGYATIAGNDSPIAIDPEPETFDTDEGDEVNSNHPLLRRIPDALPTAVWLVNVVEMCEKLAFTGSMGPLQNYLQNARDDHFRPGGLGLGQANATRLNQMFVCWFYLTPVLGAIAADQYLGRYRTIAYSSVFYVCGLALLCFSSLPFVNASGFSLPGLIVAMALFGIGVGGYKPNVPILVAEQYKGTTDTVCKLGSGENVIIDPVLTRQRIYMTFAFFVNLGSFSPIVTTLIEHHVGFWSAFLLPLLTFLVGFGVLVMSRSVYVINPPCGSVILDAFKVIWIALTNKSLEAAKPSYQATQKNPRTTSWDDVFVDDLRRTLLACQMFMLFPFYFVAYSQMQTNFISQAQTMTGHGIPNDLMYTTNAIAVLVFIPLLDRIIYPLMRRIGIPFPPTTRIFVGFILCSCAMAYAALLQHMIYQSPPCYQYPLARDCLGGNVPNQVHIAMQIPAYMLIALSEIFLLITGYEYAFTKAPPSMRSFVMALLLSTVALGSVLAIAITPWVVDPKLTWVYIGLSLETLVAGAVFMFMSKKYKELEAENQTK